MRLAPFDHTQHAVHVGYNEGAPVQPRLEFGQRLGVKQGQSAFLREGIRLPPRVR